jgi:tripartite-type tricarboxylate transporter receptor subunit TctC
MIRLWTLVAIALTALLSAASGQEYPSKPIHMVIPFGAGGGTDVLGRLLAEPLAAKLGQPIIPENKTGAGGMLGALQVAQAAPDGYTILFGNDSLVSGKFLIRNSNFDPQKDLAAVAMVAETTYALLSSPSFPARSLAEFISIVRANPGKYSYASAGVGSGPHIAFEMLKNAAKLDIIHAPFKSGNEALAAVMRGETQFTLHGLTIASENPGKIIGLGVMGDQRSRFMPDAATLKEVGVDLTASTWFGVFAPAKTPKAIVDKLNSSINECIALPNVKAAFEKLGYELRPASAADFGAQYASSFSRTGDAIKAANIPATE